MIPRRSSTRMRHTCAGAGLWTWCWEKSSGSSSSASGLNWNVTRAQRQRLAAIHLNTAASIRMIAFGRWAQRRRWDLSLHGGDGSQFHWFLPLWPECGEVRWPAWTNVAWFNEYEPSLSHRPVGPELPELVEVSWVASHRGN